MHLLTFLQVSKPGWLTRMFVLLTQGIVSSASTHTSVCF